MQNSSKTKKDEKIRLRQNLMKNVSRTANHWYMTGRRWKCTVRTVPIFTRKN
jgi:hypothetical protein